MVRKLFAVGIICIALFWVTNGAYADRLQIEDNAPLIARLLASVLLILHIGGGIVGILASAVSLTTKKGALLHRKAGGIFFYAMLVSYMIGALVAPLLETGQRPNFVGGVLATYLLISGWYAGVSKHKASQKALIAGSITAFSVTCMGVLFIYMGSVDPPGTVDGSPPQAFVLFTVAGLLSFIGDVRLYRAKQVQIQSRIIRHLWRMCFALFIGSGSLFLGQLKLFPVLFQKTPLPFLLAFIPLLVMIFWLVKIRIWPLLPSNQKRPQ